MGKRVKQDIRNAHTFHVVPYQNMWGFGRQGEDYTSNLCTNKVEAMHRALMQARNENAKVVIHRMDGKIQRILEPHEWV